MIDAVTRALHCAVAACCAYETAAILTGRAPTISNLCHRQRWLTPVILGGLALHLTPLRTLRAVRDLAEAEDIDQ